jgi:hypothetical protein
MAVSGARVKLETDNPSISDGPSPVRWASACKARPIHRCAVFTEYRR